MALKLKKQVEARPFRLLSEAEIHIGKLKMRPRVSGPQVQRHDPPRGSKRIRHRYPAGGPCSRMTFWRIRNKGTLEDFEHRGVVETARRLNWVKDCRGLAGFPGKAVVPRAWSSQG